MVSVPGNIHTPIRKRGEGGSKDKLEFLEGGGFQTKKPSMGGCGFLMFPTLVAHLIITRTFCNDVKIEKVSRKKSHDKRGSQKLIGRFEKSRVQEIGIPL